MKTTLKIIFFIVFVSAMSVANSQYLLPESNDEFKFDYQTPNPIAFTSLEQAAQWADVVAVAQVVNIDYEKTRELNSQGQAFLTVNVPYKGVNKNDLLIVNAKGFEAHQCYYPDRQNEGQRFLVFLKQSPQNNNEYLGFKPFCQLQVLLDDSGKYILRFPLDVSLTLPDTIVESVNYQDPDALVDATEWTSLKRDEYKKSFNTELIIEEDLFQKYFYLKYTQGIPLSEIRPLLKVKRKPQISSENI